MIRRALAALMQALGPVETVRFLNLPREHDGAYVEWHRRRQAGLTPEHFLDEVSGVAADKNRPPATGKQHTHPQKRSASRGSAPLSPVAARPAQIAVVCTLTE